ncbi:MFS transporter [Blastococcus sp. SYSU D00813]
MTRSAPAPRTTDQDGGYEPDPRRWQALWVTLVAGFMSLLDVSIVSVALPSMQEGLGASPAAVQWVVSGYALTFGLMLVPAGRLGDAYGRRRLFLVGLAGFVLASAAAGAAPSVEWLVAARLVQGLAAGCLAPQNSALIQQLFRGAERGRAFGLFGATIGVSTAAGPVVGGLILALAGDASGWRWVFYVNVPIGALAFVLALKLLPKAAKGDRGHIDLVGVGLLGSGALALLFPLVQAEAGGLSTLWWLFPVGALLLAAFVRWEQRVVRSGGQPVFDPRLVTQTRGYAAGASLGTVYFLGFSGIWLVLALFFQTGLDYTPLQSGLSVTPFALGSACTAVLAGRLVERYGRALTVFGLAGVAVGLAAAATILLLVPPQSAGWAVAPALLLGGLGGGFVISPNITMTLRNVPVHMAGAAGGGLQTAQRFGASIGTAALPGLFYVVLSSAGGDYAVAAAAGLAVALVTTLAALVLGVLDLRRDRREDARERAGRQPQPEPDHREFHGAHAWHG